MPKKILVVDDDFEIVELIRNRLEANQYTVLTASDGVAGFALANTEKPDLIVLDVLMPNMDGYTFVQEMKKSDELKKIPIIIVTAKQDMEEIFLNEGVSCCLFKPLETGVFLDKVQQLIGTSV